MCIHIIYITLFKPFCSFLGFVFSLGLKTVEHLFLGWFFQEIFIDTDLTTSDVPNSCLLIAAMSPVVRRMPVVTIGGFFWGGVYINKYRQSQNNLSSILFGLFVCLI